MLEKNNRLLEYVSEVMGKTYTDAVETIILFIMNLESVDRKQLITFAEDVGSDVNQIEKLKATGKSMSLVHNVTSLKILETLNSYLVDINEGRLK